MKLRVCINDETLEVEVGDLTARPILATVEGQVFEVWLDETASAPAVVNAPVVSGAAIPAYTPPAAALGSSTADKAKAIVAPIPGVILSISANTGDSVSIGQEVCVLEAMKMKNAIRASRAGTIAAVRVASGEQVRHGQVLMEFAD